ncbi:hypothetical protein AYO20_02844 [Fonsecaea nubica]|uniref:Uncharacterized protein n=1 Tax=Fonsecaea nubica TaxID=856822 RepID=A0A178D9U8_9EURO|nr:hypothetical protein AYO20_02844 [Fonsecaea nubica]OAL38011.1 hypothetical protein AYO20_02844 [Fonsecaea nubica]
MAASTASLPPCSILEKQYYITLVNLILPFYFSPAQSMPDVATTDLYPFIHSSANLYEFPHMLTARARTEYLTAHRATTRPLGEYFTDTKYEVMGDMVVSVSAHLRPTTTSGQTGSEEDGNSVPNPPGNGIAGMNVKAKVAVELLWTATIEEDCGDHLRKGLQMQSRIAVLLDFHNGQLIEQRHYNCSFPPSRPAGPSTS